VNGVTDALLSELLEQSLLAWRLPGSVHSAGDGAIAIVDAPTDVRVEPATPGLPFRWMVVVAGRRRGAISLVAVLRQVRAALDPGYANNRVRVVASPLMPS
jgi:hypothetical protein